METSIIWHLSGGVLGPVLSVIFINNLPVKSYCKIFADDTKLFKAISCPSLYDQQVLQIDLITYANIVIGLMIGYCYSMFL